MRACFAGLTILLHAPLVAQSPPLETPPSRSRLAHASAVQGMQNASLSPNNTRPQSRRILTQNTQHKLDEAVGQAQHHHGCESRNKLIQSFLNNRSVDACVQLCREILQLEPHDPQASYTLANLLADAGRPEDAIALLQQGLASASLDRQPGRSLKLRQCLFALQKKTEAWNEASATARGMIDLLHQQPRLQQPIAWLSPLERNRLEAHYLEQLGEIYRRQRRFPEALAAYQAAASLQRKRPPADPSLVSDQLPFQLAQLQREQGQFAESWQTLRAYLERHPTQLDAYELGIDLLRLQKRAEQIPSWLQTAVRAYPEHRDLSLLLARELCRNPSPNQQTRGEQLYRALAERKIDTAVYRGLFAYYARVNQIPEILALLEQTWRQYDPNENNENDSDPPQVSPEAREAARLRARTMLTVLREDATLVQAILATTQQRRLWFEPRDRSVDFWHLLAQLAVETEQPDQAIDTFLDCVEGGWSRRDLDILYALFRLLERQGEWDQLIRLCEARLVGRRRQSNALFQYYLASARASKGEYRRALAHIEQALQQTSDPLRLSLRCLKINILRRAGQLKEALNEGQQLLREYNLPEEVYPIRHRLAYVYSDLGRLADAEAEFQRLLRLDPNNPVAHNELGYRWAEHNRHLDAAESLIRRAIELDQRERATTLDPARANAAYLDSLGWVRFRKGDLHGARQNLERAADLPDGRRDPTVWDHLGDVYLRLQQPEQARQAWDRAAQLYPRFRPEEREAVRVLDRKRQQLR